MNLLLHSRIYQNRGRALEIDLQTQMAFKSFTCYNLKFWKEPSLLAFIFR